MSHEMAEVVPLHRDRENVEVSVQWAPAEEHDPGSYRRLLELLFLPRVADTQSEAA